MTDRPDLTTIDSDGLAIFSNGLLQWVTNTTDEHDALSELADEINEDGLRAEDFDFHYIPADEMPEWEDASADRYPEL